MALSQVIAQIATELVGIQAYVTTVEIGDAPAEDNSNAARIIVIPAEDEFLPPMGPGGNPRPLRDRAASAELVLRGPSMDVVEGMIDQFVIALHRTCKGAGNAHRSGSYELGKGKWTRVTRFAVSGFEWRASFSVLLPIVERTWSQTPGLAPDPSTYTGTQANTYPKAPPDTKAWSDVATERPTDGTAHGNVTVKTAP